MVATYCEMIVSMSSQDSTKQHSTERDTIVSKSLNLLQNILPQINDRKPPGVELSSVEEDTLSAHEQRMLIPSHLESRQKSMVI